MHAPSTSEDERANQIPEPPPNGRVREHPRLPVYLAPFVGREREIGQALELMQRDDVRLLTLTGPGGIGKTRLALRLATRLDSTFGNNVYFVPLASVSDSRAVLPAIARTLEITEAGHQSTTNLLKAALRDRTTLLVVDNFEQVVEAAPQLADLIASCPELTVIVTSRVTLRVQGEQEFSVPQMATPSRGPGKTWNVAPLAELATYDAIEFFVQRARSVQPAFALTEDNALAVSEICTRLDGLPLAIELAAARIKILTPSALLTRLNNRLRILTGGTRDQPERLRTMRNAIAWSYDLLQPEEQQIFQFLSVFAGGFTLDAAEAVIDDASLPIDILDGVAALVDNSLLREVDEPGGERRFMMLSTVREFGLEQLNAGHLDTDARRRHAAWCLALAERAGPELERANVVFWLDRLEREHDNIRSALGHLHEQGDFDASRRILWSLWLFWFIHCHFREARDWMRQSIASPPDVPDPIFARQSVIAGLFTETMGEFDNARELIEAGRVMAIELGDDACLGMALACLGDVSDNLGEYDRAEALFRSAAPILRRSSMESWLELTLGILGTLAQRRGDTAAAEKLTVEALDLSRQSGFVWGTGLSLNRLGHIAFNRGNRAEAETRVRESLAIWHELGDHWRLSHALIDLADIASVNGQFERAVHLLGAAQALNEPIGASEAFADDTPRQRALKRAHNHLDAERFAAAWATGRSMNWNDAVREALAPVDDQNAHPASFRYGLTARERDVLRLLVEGQTDRQIADGLFISRRTAQGHVANIFNKLGVNSRTAATTVALRDGLVESELPTP